MPESIISLFKFVLFISILFFVFAIYFLSSLFGSDLDYSGTNILSVEFSYFLKKYVTFITILALLGLSSKLIYRNVRKKVIILTVAIIFLVVLAFNSVITWLEWKKLTIFDNYPKATNKIYTHSTGSIDAQGGNRIEFETADSPRAVFDYYKNFPGKTPELPWGSSYEAQQTRLNNGLWKNLIFGDVNIDITQDLGEAVKVKIY